MDQMSKNNSPPAAYNSAPWQQGAQSAPHSSSPWLAPGGGAPQNPLDFYGSAQAQGQSGVNNIGAQTAANRPNQSNPFATSSWSRGPNGEWTQSSQLSGGLGQAAHGYESQIAGQKPLDFSGLTPINDGNQARQQAQDAAFGQAKSRLDPAFAQRGEQMDSQLAAQGLDPGSQASNTQRDQFGRDKNDAYAGAQNFAVGQGQQAQQQAYMQSMGSRQQQIAEILKQRGMPMEQLQGLQGLMQQQGFMGAGAAGPTPWLGATGDLGNYGIGQSNQSNQMAGQMASGIGGVASGILSLSDERTKQNIERHGEEAIPGVPLATFEYKHDPGRKRMGVIAQDLERVRPDLVKTGADGLKRVPNKAPFAF